jgi:hypothetical protein
MNENSAQLTAIKERMTKKFSTSTYLAFIATVDGNIQTIPGDRLFQIKARVQEVINRNPGAIAVIRESKRSGTINHTNEGQGWTKA